MQGNKESDFQQFWSKYRMVQPHHPIFLTHAGREQFCVPIAVHCDEGTTLKKKSIMIIQLHSLMGKGTRKRKSTDTEPGINMLGSTLANRVLWSVMLARVYSGKKNGNKPLEKLIEHLSSQLSDVFYKGCRLQHAEKTIYLVPICMKGDWPALAKIGSLSRHFGRAMKTGQSGGQGICHLCKADKPSFENWHDVSWGNMLRMHSDCPLPWTKEPALVRAVGIPEEYQPNFFRFDIFHALHKGLMADIGANTIVCSFEHGLFGAGAFDHLCGVCFDELKQFCKDQSMTLHMTALTRTLLGFQKSSENWFKGADTVCILLFLEVRIAAALSEPGMIESSKPMFQEVLKLLTASNKFMSTLYHSSLWLAGDERANLLTSGRAVVNLFHRLAQRAFASSETRWKYVPKFHLFGEILHQLEQEKRGNTPSLNPLAFATQQDEDFVGKVSTLSRAVSVRTVHARTLGRYLISLASKW
eukprot:Skav211437  [mRNA]  locus=scaffold1591:160572:162182:+ [translate_table: standard]